VHVLSSARRDWAEAVQGLRSDYHDIQRKGVHTMTFDQPRPCARERLNEAFIQSDTSSSKHTGHRDDFLRALARDNGKAPALAEAYEPRLLGEDAPTPGPDTKKLAEAKPGSSGPNRRRQFLAGAVVPFLLTAARAQEVTTASRTRDGHGNELGQRDVVHHSLEPRCVVGYSDFLPYGSRYHPDLPPLRVGEIEVPRVSINDVETVLQRKELLEDLPRLSQEPAFDQLLSKLAKNQAVIESLRPLCSMKDQEEVSKLLDYPALKKCIEDLASKPGFKDMVKAVDEEAFQALQESAAKKKGENEKGPLEEKQRLVVPDKEVKAGGLPLVITVVFLACLMANCYIKYRDRDRDRRFREDLILFRYANRPYPRRPRAEFFL
jgi:hypothetical protein